ncbi:hypothetical protein OIV83_004254 [Microbotryomycetes sp. JL201]|nr:hypothetical protein OIV83_004254 [Microbotryomycetes sp. JL201]
MDSHPMYQSLQQRKRVVIAVAAVVAFVLLLSSTSTSRSYYASSKTSSSLVTSDDVFAMTNATRDACARVMNDQKNLLFKTFSDVFDGVRNIALISIPDHENKGDSAIMVAESMLLAALGINIVYSCGVKDCDMETLASVVEEHGGSHFAIAFHGGGNFGDLYTREHTLKLDVMSAYPDTRMHVFPQSLKFRSDETMKQTKAVLSKLKHASIAVRDTQSYDFAMKNFAHGGLRIDMTPDIVFYMGFRPELRAHFGEPQYDVLLFRRADGERTNWDWAGGANSADFPEPFVKSLALPNQPDLTFKAGDWSGDFDISAEEKGTEPGSISHIQYRTWKRFMTGAEWLAQGEYLILDRLHGHIFSLVLGLPHALIDNKIGKLGDYYNTWTKDCPLGTLIPPENTDTAVREAYQTWVRQGKIDGRSFQ